MSFRRSTVILCILAGFAFLIISAVFVWQAQATIQVKAVVPNAALCGNGVRNVGEQCDGSALGGKTCTTLGFGGGTLGCTSVCTYQISACTTSALTTATSSFFAALGGTYAFQSASNTATFNFPTDFSTEDLQMHMFAQASSALATTKPAPSGGKFAGKAYDFLFLNSSGEGVTSLSKPATITFTYTDADIVDMSESTLAPYRWGSSDSAWQLITGSALDTANKKITFSTAAFSSFAIFGSAPAASPPAQSGGGGGGYLAPATGVVFSGRAYPKSTVTLLKDGQIIVVTIAGPDARFEVDVSGLAAGNYTFAIYGEDSQGLRSSLFTFPVFITSGVTTKIGGIFIAPTIAVDKSEVKRGDNIAIFGQSAPTSEITISVNSDEEVFVKKMSDASGAYLLNFDTSVLEIGQHNTKSKVALNGDISSFSKVIGFTVGTKNIKAELPRAITKGDVNNDRRVNLVDFSIAAYWYKRSLSASFMVVEKGLLNGDGKVDLVDFSIMAFYWTG